MLYTVYIIKKSSMNTRSPKHTKTRTGMSFVAIHWSCVYDNTDVNLPLYNFLNIFHNQLDIHIPKVKDKGTTYKKSPRLPWISRSLLRSINRKNY